MHVALVTATYLPSQNGVATSTAQFAAGLREAGHTVSVFAPRHPRQRPEAGVYRLPSAVLRRLPDYPLMLPGTPQVGWLPRGIDVFHTMHPFVAGGRALLWGRVLGVPVVYTAHTLYTEYLHYTGLPPHLSDNLMRRHVRRFARRCHAVLAPGQAMVDMLREYGHRGEVRLMPNPVDLGPYQGLSRTEARAALALSGGNSGGVDLPADAPLLVYLGRLAPEKNLPGLFAAHRAARERLPGLRLLVVGGGPSREALQREAPPGVHFTGPVPYPEVPRHLAAADLFVTASTSEVLPMSMIEAQAAGLPLVAWESPAARDLITPGVNGFLASGVSELGDRIVEALASQRLAALSRAAHAAAKRYDRATLVSELLEVYRAAGARERGAVVDKPRGAL